MKARHYVPLSFSERTVQREAARTVSSGRNLASAAGLRMHDLRSTGSYSERTEAKMQTEEMQNELST